MDKITRPLVIGILTTVIGGFILAVLVSECREIKEMHDSLIRLEQQKKFNEKP